ncbi:MAG: DUF1697 domain-containing protein [Pseudomonadales bacterium]|nr:DUF1697 domain-containing protein [Pseudomonadales bacterium]MCP5171259.1 DUF1697 domain-containing protein [Pseudomonadales bacterium]
MYRRDNRNTYIILLRGVNVGGKNMIPMGLGVLNWSWV